MSNHAHRERLMQVLLGPHVSEKATALAEAGKNGIRVTFAKEGANQAVRIMGCGHANRSWEGGFARASASMLARSARVAWCRRDFAVPTGIPVRAATSEMESPR